MVVLTGNSDDEEDDGLVEVGVDLYSFATSWLFFGLSLVVSVRLGGGFGR